MANWVLYDNWRLRLINGNATNLASGGDAVKCALIASSPAPNGATDVSWNAPGYTEMANGNGYTTGGLTVSAGQTVALAGGIVTWATSTAFQWVQNASGFSTARYAVLYDSTTNTLIAYFDLGGNVGNVAGALAITGPATAIMTSP